LMKSEVAKQLPKLQLIDAIKKLYSLFVNPGFILEDKVQTLTYRHYKGRCA